MRINVLKIESVEEFITLHTVVVMPVVNKEVIIVKPKK